MRHVAIRGRRLAGAIVLAATALATGTATAQLVATGTVGAERQAPLQGNQSVNVRSTVNLIAARLSLTGPSSRLEAANSPSPGTRDGSPAVGGFALRGMAAGNGVGHSWGLWGSVQRADFEDDFAATAFEATGDSLLFGADVSPVENIVLGIVIGYDNTNVDTTFNAGEQDIETLTAATYLGMQLGERLGVGADVSLSVSLGIAGSDIDQFRTAGGTRISGSTDSSRWFAAADLTAGRKLGNFYGTLGLGFLLARDEVDAFTESNGTAIASQDLDLGQLSVGGSLAYGWGAFEPFVSAYYRHDFEREDIVLAGAAAQPANDDDDVRLGLGLRYFGSGPVSGSIEWNRTLGREDFDENIFSALLRVEF